MTKRIPQILIIEDNETVRLILRTALANAGYDVIEAADGRGGLMLYGRWYRGLEEKLGIAQRARQKKRVQAIHAKIANRRKDAMHPFSRKLVNENTAIFVGNVNFSVLVKTKLAKSVLDAGWGMLKTLLAYKCDHAGGIFREVNEAYTTQTCSNCLEIHDSRPKGRAGLEIREWTCSECGVTHDRDVNGAQCILALGHQRLAGGIPVLSGREDVKDNLRGHRRHRESNLVDRVHRKMK